MTAQPSSESGPIISKLARPQIHSSGMNYSRRPKTYKNEKQNLDAHCCNSELLFCGQSIQEQI